MSALPPLPKDEPTERIGAWAPGAYLCRCLTCNEQFWGDKRALNCLPCALKYRDQMEQPS